MTKRYSVRLLRGTGLYEVVDQDGQRIGEPSSHEELIRQRRDRMQRQAEMRPRNCLTCGDTFQSEGIHNRMCDHCRGRSHSTDMRMFA